MIDYTFKVAGHQFRLSLSEKNSEKISIENYIPFTVECNAEDCLFHLIVTDNSNISQEYAFIGNFDNDVASIAVGKNKEGDFRFRLAYPNTDISCTMEVNSFFSKAYVYLPKEVRLHTFFLDNCLMLLYAFATANLDTLLLHASVVENKEQGFIFLGKSGTGKSTHSRLWLEHIAETKLLNDDNPIIRIVEDKAYVFGSPWSGKTPCYRNNKASLKGILKLRQAPKNEIRRLSTLQAYANILPACSCMRWEDCMMQGIHSTVEKLVVTIGCHHLDCLPDVDAALLSYNTLKE